MAEGHRWYPHVAFVDAHNCMTDLGSPVHAATLTAREYQHGAETAMEGCQRAEMCPFSVGVAHQTVPYSREQGFGDLGIQALVVETSGQKTAYVLIDGNNMAQGVREILVNEIRTLVDAAEVMTTDSHVVNTITIKNPVGMNVPSGEFLPLPAHVAAGTAQCKGIVVFGSNRILQLASTVNAMLIYVAPLSLGMLLLAFLLSLIAYIVIV